MEKSPNHKLPDQYVARLMKLFLGKEPCRSRGYVLDGYPKTTEQAREIFGQVAETEMAGEGGEGGGGVLPPMEGEGGMGGEGQTDADMGMMSNAVNQILPDYVVSLVGTDDFLCERVMKLPQREIQGTHYEEESMLHRLLEFRENNTERNTMLNFFDESGIHPIVISLIDEETEKERDIDCIYDYVSDIFGEPIPGFGLSAEEMERLRKLEREQRRLREEEERLEKQLLEEKARKEYQDKMEKWAETLEKLQMEEEKVLVAQSEPLRYYLMKYVFPVLSKGLIEVAKIRPDDPLDYLAEYLFRENPEGRMFDPSYTREGELILKQYEEQVAPTIGNNDGSILEKMRNSVS
ncbi:unnamed protein product [Callosobruchus maculatus]|uniref:Adenylate kinase 7 n=1 Tax=Callosobruchus maculatus TaxID=64391 RepID=A0A653BWW8_CALMS|nr:unnamed protein product [Callosobruchus maculatus]